MSVEDVDPRLKEKKRKDETKARTGKKGRTNKNVEQKKGALYNQHIWGSN